MKKVIYLFILFVSIISCESDDKETLIEDNNEIYYETFGGNDLNLVELKYPLLNQENDTIIFKVEANILLRDPMTLESGYLNSEIIDNENRLKGIFFFLNEESEELETFSSPGGTPFVEVGYFYNSDSECFIYGTLITGTDGTTFFQSYSQVSKITMGVQDICAGPNEGFALIL